jgi:hypothetical protein
MPGRPANLDSSGADASIHYALDTCEKQLISLKGYRPDETLCRAAFGGRAWQKKAAHGGPLDHLWWCQA